MAAVENLMAAKSDKTEPSAVSKIELGFYVRKIVSFLARNFFKMKIIALLVFILHPVLGTRS